MLENFLKNNRSQKLRVLLLAFSFFIFFNTKLEKDLNQYFAVLTNIRSVGVMGDYRTYDYTIALRSVKTTDFMTATWSKIPYDVL